MPVARTHFFSDTLGFCVACDVVLPKLQRDDLSPLPVLWLLHGAYGDHSDWLYRTGLVRYVERYRLAVVMPSAQNSCYVDMAHGGRYYTFITQELPQKMRLFFRFSDQRADNFIAGLSMGGMGSLMLGLANANQYAAIGCFSAGATLDGGGLRRSKRWALAFGNTPISGTYKDPFGSARRILDEGLPRPRIYHVCGTEDFLLADARKTRDFFCALPGDPFDYTYLEAPGAHTWDFWDTHIQGFLRFLRLPDSAARQDEHAQPCKTCP